MSEQFLDGANVLAGFEQMRSKRMPERVAADAFADPRTPRRGRDGSLNDAFMQMEA